METGNGYICKATASGLMTFLLGGFLNAANKVPSMEPKAFLRKKKGLQCGKKNFPEKNLIKSLWMWDLNLTIDVSISKYIEKT